MSPALTKVLVANRAEIAVRVVRACRDAGIASVAVYADQDRNAPHVRMADEAFALEGLTPAETYLDRAKLLAILTRSGADGVHPGYGFLSENADFAQAVTDAGVTWIGPPPAAIRELGDKTRARQIASRVGAPLAPGLDGPVTTVSDVEAFVQAVGLPIIVKAAFGGGGRGMRVVREIEDIGPALEGAAREATSAFGRGELFVELFIEHARHVETQCLADASGKVVVISTRDCTLQRRGQKLIEEAPAPFLSDEQAARLYEASKAILKAVGYLGAGTCEFLIASDGSISFNEVNTRLQVEHAVSEEVTGIDLVREQLRIAAGELIGHDDPPIRGHSIELRLNAEDPGQNFLPSAGTITRLVLPGGPGIRIDIGYAEGDDVPTTFDSLIGKLIVTGANREQAIERARRALSELVIEGLTTVVPFHRHVLTVPGFIEAPMTVHTRWIESDLDVIFEPTSIPVVGETGIDEVEREQIVVEVNGRRIDVSLPRGLFGQAVSSKRIVPRADSNSSRGNRRGAAGRKRPMHHDSAGGSGDVVSPMQGTVVAVLVEAGQSVVAGEVVVVVEAMKMEQALTARSGGTVVEVSTGLGAKVQAGQVLCRIEANWAEPEVNVE